MKENTRRGHDGRSNDRRNDQGVPGLFNRRGTRNRNGRKISEGYPFFFYVAFGKKGGKNADGGMERPPCKKWVFTIYGELYAFFPEWIPGVYGMGKMPGKVSADTEGAVSEKGTGFAAERVLASEAHRQIKGKRTSAAVNGDDLRDGRPGIGSEIYHRGSGEKEKGRNSSERESPGNPAGRQAVPEAAGLCEKTGDFRGGGFRDAERKRTVPAVHMAGDEEAVQGCACGAVESVSA